MTGGDALARALLAAGVTDLFGVPAGKLAPLFRAVAAEPRFRTIGVRHEAAAAWMAAAAFQSTGRVAACFGESGPGSLNLVGGLGSASANGLAVLVLTPGTATPLAYPHHGAVMDIDNVSLFAAVTKSSRVVRGGTQIRQAVQDALVEATSGRPGPVYLELPGDVLAAPVQLTDAELAPPAWPARVRADPAEVEQAAQLLAGAERPLVLAGGGVAVSDAAAELRALVTLLGAAATATQMGLGSVSTADPRFIGHGGVIGGPAVVRALEEADVVLAVGCRFSSWLWAGGRPIEGAGQQLVHVDVDPAALGHVRPAAVGLLGDARTVLAQLLDVLKGHEPSPTAWRESLAAEYRSYRDGLRALGAPGEDVLHPAVLADEVATWLPEDALVVYDGGHTSFWSNDLTPALDPRTRFHEPGMAHLGFGVPYANALALLHPGRTVVNLTGDGAFGFTIQELDTARRYGLAPMHVIHDNQAWGVISVAQRRLGFEHGVELAGTDYAAIATGFGCHAERVTRREEIAPALDRARASGLPAVVDVRVRFEPHPGMRLFSAATAVG